MSNLVVLYGPPETGKSSYLEQLVQYYRTLGLEVRGLISPAIIYENIKTGIRAKDISTGETRFLAAKRPVPLTDNSKLGYVFNEQTVAWGNEVLSASVPTEVLIIDEIGPLELKLNKGWTNALDCIRRRSYQLAIVVLRESLHDEIRNKWSVAEWLLFQRGMKVNQFDQFFHETRT
jgi:nucleoside-triphosphatase THEP1